MHLHELFIHLVFGIDNFATILLLPLYVCGVNVFSCLQKFLLACMLLLQLESFVINLIFTVLLQRHSDDVAADDENNNTLR